MLRVWLESCWPCFVALAMAFVLARLLLAASGARWQWRRLRDIHHCQRGGVQTLAFVLTLPLFMMITMFVIQVSQLMVAQMVIHYAAFAGARAASVWIPAAVDTPPLNFTCESHVDEEELFGSDPLTGQSRYLEMENRLGIMPTPAGADVDPSMVEATSDSPSTKLRKIRTAVLQAAMPMCPSRSVGAAADTPELRWTIPASQRMYAALAPQSQSNSRIPQRIANKLAYADAATQVFVQWRDGRNPFGRDSLDYRAYNVRNHPNPQIQFHPNEVGWQDPITVYVAHDFALIPGPGRFLSTFLVRSDGLPDNVSPKIRKDTGTFKQTMYTTRLEASATIVPEGIKSIRPYVQP